MSNKGFPSQEKRGNSEFATIQNLGSGRHGLDVIQRVAFPTTVAAKTIAAPYTGSELKATKRILNIVAHDARLGDFIRFSTGLNKSVEAPISQVVDANHVAISYTLENDPIALDELFVMRPISLSTDENGNLSVTSGAEKYLLDSVLTDVEVDTATPANNRALPAMTYYDLDGVQTAVIKDTVTAANTRALPVSLVDVTGVDAVFNVTTGALNIETSHDGIAAAFDSMRIGNGTNLMAVNASLEATINDADMNSAMGQTVSPVVANSTIDSSLIGYIRSVFRDLQLMSAKFGTIGQQARAASAAVTLSTEDALLLSGMSAKLPAALGQLSRATSLSTTWSTEDQAIMDTFSAKFGTIGQQARAASAAVTLSTEDIALITAMSAKLPATLGSKVDAASLAVTQSTEDKAVQAAMSAKLPSVIGQNLEADSMSVVLASDQAALPASSMDTLAFSLTDLTGVTNAAYTEIMADTGGNATKRIKMFMSSGVPLFLAIGAAAAEVDKLIIPPGGFPDGYIDLIIPANSRLSVKAYTALGPVAAGDLIINVMG